MHKYMGEGDHLQGMWIGRKKKKRKKKELIESRSGVQCHAMRTAKMGGDGVSFAGMYVRGAHGQGTSLEQYQKCRFSIAR